MHRPGAVQTLSTQESEPGQSLLSLQGRGSQQPDSPQIFPEGQLPALQRS